MSNWQIILASPAMSPDACRTQEWPVKPLKRDHITSCHQRSTLMLTSPFIASGRSMMRSVRGTAQMGIAGTAQCRPPMLRGILLQRAWMGSAINDTLQPAKANRAVLSVSADRSEAGRSRFRREKSRSLSGHNYGRSGYGFCFRRDYGYGC